MNREAELRRPSRVAWSVLLGIIVQGVSFPDFCRLLVLLIKPLAHLPLIALLKFRYAVFKAHTKIPMCLCKTRIICLKRGYLTGNEPNLRTNLVLWRVAINHPVKILKVILECYHNVSRDLMPNEKSSGTADGEPGQKCKEDDR